MELTIGRQVHYKLTAYEAGQVNARRADAKAAADSHPHPHEPGQAAASGHIMPVGNPVREGSTFPAIVVAVFAPSAANLQVFLDGNDTLWTTSVHEGDDAGTWSWPVRV